LDDTVTDKVLYENASDIDRPTLKVSSNDSDTTLKGLNSFCLVAREELPSNTNNLFHFTDIDRDSMVDMIFITKNDLSLHVYYNKL
jgi:hypothetical protein